MTYQQAIQIQIRALQQVYDNIGALRDVATEEDKKHCNVVRGALPSVWNQLQKIDDNTSIPDHKLTGDYSIHETCS